MTSRYNIFFILTLAGLLVLTACEGIADLDIENENEPDADRAIVDAGDLMSVLAGAYASWWDGTYENSPAYGPQMHLDGYADAMTTTNAFAGFWNVSVDEPRVQFPNTLTFGDLHIIEDPWQQLNAAISSANDVIHQVEDNNFEVIIGGDDQAPMALAGAYFVRALSYGHLANFFDKAFIVPSDYDPETETLEFSPYDEVLAQARSDFQRVREIAQANTFTLDNFLPFTTTVTSQRLIELSNSFEARYVVSNARTPAENDAINWAEILNLTQNGIQSDVVMQLDGSTWFNYYQYISGLHWYWRVDNRIINMMDDSYPVKYPADMAGQALAPAQSEDERLCPTSGESDVFDGIDFFQGDGLAVAREFGCYFVYDTDQSFFREDRGPTLQSNYWYGRDFADIQWNQTPFAAGPGPIFLLEENRLMQAEAEIRANNDPAAAAQLVNEGSRVTVGGLEPLSEEASAEEVLDAIFYERDIELYRTGWGVHWYDMRRRGLLQAGTPLHLPIPATELQTIGEPLYTFGGVGNAGQPGTASGDNAWCDQGGNSCDGPFTAPGGSIVVQEHTGTSSSTTTFSRIARQR